MAALFALWVYPPTGFGDEYAAAMLRLGGGDSSVAMLCMLGIFAVAHRCLHAR